MQALRNYRVFGPDAAVEFIPDNVDLTLKNINYTKTRAGEPLWTLVADSATHSKEEGTIRIKNVRMTFFDRETGDIELTADQGELMPEYRRVTVSSNVIVLSSPENTLQTEYLEYDEASNILETDRMVKINFDHFKVSGKGMQMNVKEQSIVLLSDVKAEYKGVDSQ